MITKIEENEGVMTVYLEGRLVAGIGTLIST